MGLELGAGDLTVRLDNHLMTRDSAGGMQGAVSKAERYRKGASKYAERAKHDQPAYLGEVYRKVAVRYVFMAEELLNGPSRNGDAIERADRMISRLRRDPAIGGRGAAPRS
jgi:hypothetical protein